MLIDSHVHLFPPRVFDAIWRWFDAHAWKIQYRLHAEEVIEFLSARGIDRLVGLAYSHVPEMARALNRFMAELGRNHPRVIPLGTVLPGEPDAAAIVDEALGALGLRGLKLHCHVQKFAPDDPRCDSIYTRAADARVPVVIHAGRAPCLAAYRVDIHALCSAAAIRRVLERHPRLTLVVPHLGLDELDGYRALLDQFENLHLDTTMAHYLSPGFDSSILETHSNRILYGTDFPNVPYAWDSELDWLRGQTISEDARRKILGDNARALFE